MSCHFAVTLCTKCHQTANRFLRNGAAYAMTGSRRRASYAESVCAVRDRFACGTSPSEADTANGRAVGSARSRCRS